ncbi:hypothetical protein K470DRAFT_265611 [Piedraia hortae CBS 480.64]|uniref:Uncharacterized protein n=1 Tax=Piedraia hortae CBS 480.64 TaxID=1314780 RepID=A0A6A7BV27_9PEZI|nr:hypothetical protein K470DRAFT_265611 [Piedraia hortae CBS 480.64]
MRNTGPIIVAETARVATHTEPCPLSVEEVYRNGLFRAVPPSSLAIANRWQADNVADGEVSLPSSDPSAIPANIEQPALDIGLYQQRMDDKDISAQIAREPNQNMSRPDPSTESMGGGEGVLDGVLDGILDGVPDGVPDGIASDGSEYMPAKSTKRFRRCKASERIAKGGRSVGKQKGRRRSGRLRGRSANVQRQSDPEKVPNPKRQSRKKRISAPEPQLETEPESQTEEDEPPRQKLRRRRQVSISSPESNETQNATDNMEAELTTQEHNCSIDWRLMDREPDVISSRQPPKNWGRCMADFNKWLKTEMRSLPQGSKVHKREVMVVRTDVPPAGNCLEMLYGEGVNSKNVQLTVVAFVDPLMTSDPSKQH